MKRDLQPVALFKAHLETTTTGVGVIQNPRDETRQATLHDGASRLWYTNLHLDLCKMVTKQLRRVEPEAAHFDGTTCTCYEDI